MKVRVLLVDDHPITREGVKRIVPLLAEFHLFGKAGSKGYQPKCPVEIMISIDVHRVRRC